MTEITSNSDEVVETSTPSVTTRTTRVVTSVVTQTPTAATEPPVTVVITLPSTTQPLTTFFTPPADCTNGIWTSNTTSLGTMICTRRYTSSCFPSSYRSANVFSPGACPYAYDLGGVFTDPDFPSVTSRVCCPAGMTFSGIDRACHGILSGYTSVVVDNSTIQYSDSFAALTEEITVAWAATELDAFTPASAPLLQIFATSIFATAGQTATAPSPTTDSSSSGGLAQSAKIGIGVGVACTLLILSAIAGLVVYWRVRGARKTASSGDAVRELPGDDNQLKAELGGNGIQESGGDEVPAEADHTHARYELEGDWHGHEAHGPRSPT